ncbi:MAG: hypothetical protein R3250_00055 [Melioribacteraceae bacterium]|nr:hypothetical protein [Melioribacteraceae bacterium]
MEIKWLFIGFFLLAAYVFGATIFSTWRYDNFYIHLSDRERLIHERITTMIEKIERDEKRIKDLELLVSPNERLNEIEKFQRTLCSAPKIEACAGLGKINK